MCVGRRPRQLESGKQPAAAAPRPTHPATPRPAYPFLPEEAGSTWKCGDGLLHPARLPRKEVIQPHLPVRLPCYDFTPITDPTLDACLPLEERVGPAASGVADFRGVTGGVYKTRDRIHRGVRAHGY